MLFDQVKPTRTRARDSNSMHMEWRQFSGDSVFLQPIKRQGGRRAARSVEGSYSLCFRVIEQCEHITANPSRRRLGDVECHGSGNRSVCSVPTSRQNLKTRS